jgi:sugar/nucleoside kinase (ribokinase family)
VRALVVGDLAVVIMASVPRLPRAGENFLLSDPRVYASGVGANLSWNLVGLGIECEVASGVGRDGLGDYVLAELTRRGIGVGNVERFAAATSTFLILVDPSGERTMIGYRGAAERFFLDPAELTEPPADWVHVSGYTLLDPAMAERCDELITAAEARGVSCSVDLEGIAQSGRHTPLDRVTAFCNLDEYRRYFGHDRVRPMERAAPLVVKAGDEGSFLVEGGTVTPSPPLPARAVDSTGAGDAFNAGFIAARLLGRDSIEACGWGNAAARIKVEVPGPHAELSVAAIELLVESGRRDRE